MTKLRKFLKTLRVLFSFFMALIMAFIMSASMILGEFNLPAQPTSSF